MFEVLICAHLACARKNISSVFVYDPAQACTYDSVGG
jgi:hypothetical protein